MLLPPFEATPLSRRAFLRGAALGGAGLIGASVLGCGSDEGGSSATATPVLDASPTPGGQSTTTAPSLQWTRVPVSGSLPPPRYDHTIVTDGTKIYLFGGRSPEPRDDLWAFDIAAGSWTELSPAQQPVARFGHNAVWDPSRSRVVIFGGQAGANFFNDIWEYDPAVNAWSDPTAGVDLAVAPAARYGAASCLDGSGHLLVSHGFTSEGRFDDTTEVSPSTDRPTPRCLIDGVWDTRKERLMIFGGQSNDAPYMDDLWGWSTVTDWQRIARAPSPSARNLYAFVYDATLQQAFLIGGQSADGPLGDTWAFHSDGETWTQTDVDGRTRLPARYSHDACVTPEGGVYVFGGTDDSTTYSDLWQLERNG
jgi:N-acetylneuraminic acid mutarotase